jgi:ubiquinone/menaquinone biosynthesis methyltransferase
VTAEPGSRRAPTLFAPLGPTYDRYARLLSLGQDPRWRRFLVSRLEVGRDARVLDVATGTGAVALELVRRYGCSVVGIDRSPEMLAVARRRVAAHGLGERIELLEGRAEALPFADDSFDTVVSTMVLCTVPDPTRALDEVRRILRPDGSLLFVEHVRSDDPRLARWQDRLQGAWHGFADGCNCNRQTADLLRGAGYVVSLTERADWRRMPPIVRPLIIGSATPAR